MIYINAGENNTVTIRISWVRGVQNNFKLLNAKSNNAIYIQMLNLTDFLPPSADGSTLSLISLTQLNVINVSDSSLKNIKKWRIIVCDEFNTILFANISIYNMILNDNHGMISYFNGAGNQFTLSGSTLSNLQSSVEFGSLLLCRYQFAFTCPGGLIRSNGRGLFLKVFKLNLADMFSFVGVIY